MIIKAVMRKRGFWEDCVEAACPLFWGEDSGRVDEVESVVILNQPWGSDFL